MIDAETQRLLTEAYEGGLLSMEVSLSRLCFSGCYAFNAHLYFARAHTQDEGGLLEDKEEDVTGGAGMGRSQEEMDAEFAEEEM